MTTVATARKVRNRTRCPQTAVAAHIKTGMKEKRMRMPDVSMCLFGTDAQIGNDVVSSISRIDVLSGIDRVKTEISCRLRQGSGRIFMIVAIGFRHHGEIGDKRHILSDGRADRAAAARGYDADRFRDALRAMSVQRCKTWRSRNGPVGCDKRRYRRRSCIGSRPAA